MLTTIRMWLADRGWRAHSQNLAKEDRERRFNRRGWLYLGDACQLSWQLVAPSATFNMGFDLDDEDMTLKCCIPPVSLYLGLQARWQRKLFYALVPKEDQYKGGMTTSIRVFDWAVWWDVWHTAHEWNSKTPRWRSGSLHFVDAILGRMKFSSEVLSEHDALVPMPEGAYPASITLTRDTWTRPKWPRWPFTRAMFRGAAEVKKGIPHPGNGENSWDCGDDATFGISGVEARTVEQVVSAYVETVLRSRRRYGGGSGTEPWPTAPVNATQVAK